MKKIYCIVLLCFTFSTLSGQRLPDRDRRPTSTVTSSILNKKAPPQSRVLKHPGRYTIQDWRLLVDSAWGEGMPTAQKLEVFDTFWNRVNITWGGFSNLVVDWDSLRTVYRPIVAAGVSRGRFYGIMSTLTAALSEWHVYACDLGIDSSLGREVATLVNEVKQPGSYIVQWEASGMPTGVYFYRLQTGSYTETKKMIIMR